jgi:hypothetical protein
MQGRICHKVSLQAQSNLECLGRRLPRWRSSRYLGFRRRKQERHLVHHAQLISKRKIYKYSPLRLLIHIATPSLMVCSIRRVLYVNSNYFKQLAAGRRRRLSLLWLLHADKRGLFQVTLHQYRKMPEISPRLRGQRSKPPSR